MSEPTNTFREESAAFGQRVTGAAKDAAGAVTGNEALEREGERENAAGRARQAANDVGDSTPARSDYRYVSGLYGTPAQAEQAYTHLTATHGYAPEDVDVLMSADTRSKYYPGTTPGQEFSGGTKAAEGLGVGSVVGGGVGAALAAVFAVGSNVVIPGLGLVVAGPIAAALAGAGAGGAAGGLIGALIGAGVPEDRALEYERGLKDGGIVVGTRARDAAHAASLERDYQSWGATNVRK